MIKKHFSFEETLRFSWAKTLQHAWFLVLTFIIANVIISAVKFTPIINVVVAVLVCLSIASISLMISRDQSFTFRDLYTPLLSPHRVLKFFALTIIYLIPIFVLFLSYAVRLLGALSHIQSFFVLGTILMFLLVIPVTYLSVRLKFFPFILLDNENATVKELLFKSYRLTKGHFLPVFGFLLAIGLLNTIGFLFFVVGLVVIIPISLFATAHVYNKLREHSF
jgi:hypothetical protein